MILTVKGLQVESHEDKEVLMPFKDVVGCVVNNEKIYLTKDDLALSNTKIENWFTQQNKWLAVVSLKISSMIFKFCYRHDYG